MDYVSGQTGSLGHSGVVQPQEAITRVMTKGISPALEMVNISKQSLELFSVYVNYSGYSDLPVKRKYTSKRKS